MKDSPRLESGLGITKDGFAVDPKTRFGVIRLRVKDLAKSVFFYRHILGLQEIRKTETTAVMGTKLQDLIYLVEVPEGKINQKSIGLYHYALLLPSKKELARVLARLYSVEYSHFPTDHLMTMTSYLWDPDGNGIELYADTPDRGSFAIENGEIRAVTAQGEPHSAREVLEVHKLMDLLKSGESINDPLPEETRIGHLHLHVNNIPVALDFYSGILGYGEKGWAKKIGMAFVAAGDYHHHLGFNLWKGTEAPMPGEKDLGMDWFSIIYPTGAVLEEVVHRLGKQDFAVKEGQEGYWVQDPFRNSLLLTEETWK
jgi:catechol 2,3-dioxygenase